MFTLSRWQKSTQGEKCGGRDEAGYRHHVLLCFARFILLPSAARSIVVIVVFICKLVMGFFLLLAVGLASGL